MKLYEVSYWDEGPGRSGTDTVLVMAKNKADAIKTTIKSQGVYKADQDSVHAKRVPAKSQVIRYVGERR